MLRVPPGTRSTGPYRHFDTAVLNALPHDTDRLAQNPPGQTRGCSNLGYAILGAALEAPCATPYEELVCAHDLDPCASTE